MIANLYIPFGYGDCIDGFKYEGVISEAEYIKKIITDYNIHKIGVDEMMHTSFSRNMARNTYTKENNVYKQTKGGFGEVKCYIDNKDFDAMSIDDLLDNFEQKKSFPIIIRIYNRKEIDPDVEIDLRSWMSEYAKVDRLKKYSDAEKFKVLSKKDLKLTFDEKSKMAAILKNCKIVNVYSNMKFALWVDKIIFVKEITEK